MQLSNGLAFWNSRRDKCLVKLLFRSSTNTSSTTTEEIPPPDTSNVPESKLSQVSQVERNELFINDVTLSKKHLGITNK